MIKSCKWVTFPSRSSQWASATELLKGWKRHFEADDIIWSENLAEYLKTDVKTRIFFLESEKIETVPLTEYLLAQTEPGGSSVTVLLPVIGNPVFAAVAFSFLRENMIKENRNINFSLVAGCLTSKNILEKFFSEGVTYLPFVPPDSAISVAPIQENLSEEKTIVYAGRISHFKNVNTLLDLFEEFGATRPYARLRIIGRPDNFNWPNVTSGCYFNYTGEHFFEKLANVQKRSSKVTYVGGLSRDETLIELAQSDCVTSLSTAPEEDFGLVLCEAAQLNKSIVATKWGGFHEFANLENTRLIAVKKIDRTLSIDKKQLFQCWDSALTQNNLTNGISFENWINSRLNSPLIISSTINAPNESTLNIFRDYERIDLNQEFYEHAEHIYSPLWE